MRSVLCLGRMLSHMHATHIYSQRQMGVRKWPSMGLNEGARQTKKGARRLTPTMDITIAAVMAQEMTPALSPAPYDWLATATIHSHTACSHLSALHIEAHAQEP